MSQRYESPEAFRQALQARLRAAASQRAEPVGGLRAGMWRSYRATARSRTDCWSCPRAAPASCPSSRLDR